MAADQHERRDVPEVDEVVDLQFQGAGTQDGKRVPDHHQGDQSELGVVEPRVATHSIHRSEVSTDRNSSGTRPASRVPRHTLWPHGSTTDTPAGSDRTSVMSG